MWVRVRVRACHAEVERNYQALLAALALTLTCVCSPECGGSRSRSTLYASMMAILQQTAELKHIAPASVA